MSTEFRHAASGRIVSTTFMDGGFSGLRPFDSGYAGPQTGTMGAEHEAIAEVLAQINPMAAYPEESFYDDELGYALPRPTRRPPVTEWDDPFASEVDRPWVDDPYWGLEGESLAPASRGSARKYVRKAPPVVTESPPTPEAAPAPAPVPKPEKKRIVARTLYCRDCREPFVWVPRTGRPPTYCPDHRPAHRRTA